MIEPTLYWIAAVNKELDLKPNRVVDLGSREQKGRSGSRTFIALISDFTQGDLMRCCAFTY